MASFWAALTAPEAVFALKLSMVTSFWATFFNVLFGLFAAYVLSRYNFWGRNALIVTISLPTAIPTAVAGFALLLVWGPYGHPRPLSGAPWDSNDVYGRSHYPRQYLCYFSAGFGVIKPVFDTMSRSLEEASATIGATRIQTFWHVTLAFAARCDCLRGAADVCPRRRRIWFDNSGLRKSCGTARKPPRCTFLPSSTRGKSRPQMPSRLCWPCSHL